MVPADSGLCFDWSWLSWLDGVLDIAIRKESVKEDRYNQSGPREEM